MSGGVCRYWSPERISGALRGLASHPHLVPLFSRTGAIRPSRTLVSRPPNTLTTWAAFRGPEDIDGTIISPVPNNQKQFKDNGHYRIWPPNASWYTPIENRTVWGKDGPPQDWEKSEKSLMKHKQKILDACDGEGADWWQKKLILAIAMQETEYMWGRDPSKDRDPNGAKNVWCLNLNIDMLRKLPDYQEGEDLTKPESLQKVIHYLLEWFDGKAVVRGQAQSTPHVRSTLNYIRYGQTGYEQADDRTKNVTLEFKDDKVKHVEKISDICREYRNAIATVYYYLDSDKPPANHGSLWNSNERLGIDVPWV